MKEMFVQFKSGRTLEVKDICDYVESQDFDVVVSKGIKETHLTIFHDAVEFMTVMDNDISDPDEIRSCWTCAHKNEDHNYCFETRKCNQYSAYEKEEN